MLRLIEGTPLGTSIVKKDTQDIFSVKKRNERWVAQSEFEKAGEFNGQ